MEQLNDYYSKYATRLNRLVGHKIGNYEEREEIVQDAFVRAIEYWHAFNGDNFYAWIATIAMNLATNHLRRDQVVSFTPLDTTWEVQDFGPEPEQILLQNEAQSIVRGAVETLSPRLKEATTYLLQDFSQPEIAGKMGITTGCVKSTLYRAREQLQPLLKDYV